MKALLIFTIALPVLSTVMASMPPDKAFGLLLCVLTPLGILAMNSRENIKNQKDNYETITPTRRLPRA